MRVERSYDVPPRALLDVLTDRQFLSARGARYGGRGAAAVERAGDAVVVTVPRQLPVDAVPPAFRSLVGSGELVQTDTWSAVDDGRVIGKWSADVGDRPVRLAGLYEITAAGAGCQFVITGDVKVNVPLIGGRAEKLIRERLEALLRTEQDFAADWLAGPGHH